MNIFKFRKYDRSRPENRVINLISESNLNRILTANDLRLNSLKFDEFFHFELNLEDFIIYPKEKYRLATTLKFYHNNSKNNNR
jgi:hypothetical protein